MTETVVEPTTLAAAAAVAVAAQHQTEQAAVSAGILASVLAAWAEMDAANIVDSWESGILDRIFALISSGQERAAAAATDYVRRALEVQGHDVSLPTLDPLRFAGIASDGRSLEGLLDGALVRSFESLAGGAQPAEALTSGRAFLIMATTTQLSDAGRAADQVAITGADSTSKPKLRYGWVRMLEPPSCSRCIILAGKFFKWNDGFERHPMCDCRHIPMAESDGEDVRTDAKKYFDSLSETDQNYYFGKANAEAIRNGADIFQVVNATKRKGAMFTADNGKRYTREGTTRRGYAGRNARRGGRVLRPTPWQIYKDANGDRDAALTALQEFGYIVAR